MSIEGSDLNVERRTEGEQVILTVSGEVDLHSSPELRGELLEALEGRPQRLIIDLSGVTYMDSSGVGTIVEAKRRADKAASTLVLTGLQPRVRSVFEITQLDKFFKITDSVDEAREA